MVLVNWTILISFLSFISFLIFYWKSYFLFYFYISELVMIRWVVSIRYFGLIYRQFCNKFIISCNFYDNENYFMSVFVFLLIVGLINYLIYFMQFYKLNEEFWVEAKAKVKEEEAVNNLMIANWLWLFTA